MNEYTTNQPIGSTVSNERIFSTGVNPPAHQGGKWQTEIRDADKNNTPLITNEPNKGENENIYSVLIDLQRQIQIANDYLTRGDLVRLYEQLLLKL